MTNIPLSSLDAFARDQAVRHALSSRHSVLSPPSMGAIIDGVVAERAAFNKRQAELRRAEALRLNIRLAVSSELARQG